jgi:hypothetical protein
VSEGYAHANIILARWGTAEHWKGEIVEPIEPPEEIHWEHEMIEHPDPPEGREGYLPDED